MRVLSLAVREVGGSGLDAYDASSRAEQRLEAETHHGSICENTIRFQEDADHAAETARSGGNEEVL